ncbi:MAG TPA: FadR/GntR family transcriptional regulator [Rhodothermales bacterium]
MRPLVKSNLADGLADRIVQLIRSGVYQPGDRLPAIMEMARSFGVGHPTLREALKKLEIVGVVEIKHGSGVYVGRGQDVLLVSNPVYGGEVTKKLLLDLIEARIPIEVKSASLAAVQASDEQLDSMQALLDHAKENMSDAAVLSETNMSFHREIAAASGNAVLAQLQEVLTNLFQHEQRMILDIYGSREADHAGHIQILEALRSRDSDLAAARMQAHLEGVGQALLQWDSERDPV